MNRIKVIIRFFAENITAVLAIICGVWYFFSYKQYDTQELLAYIISILVFIAGSMLIERLVNISSIDKRIKNLESKLVYEDVFMYCHAKKFWDEAEKHAKKIIVSGGSLYHVIAERSGVFEKLLSNNCEIEVIVVKPYSEAAKLLCNEVVKEVNSTTRFSEHTVECLGLLEQYKKRFPKAKITIRLNDQVPPYGLFALYESTKQGIKPRLIQVNFFSGKVAYDKRLALWIENSTAQSQIAYDYFCDRIIELQNRLNELSDDQLVSILRNEEVSDFG